MTKKSIEIEEETLNKLKKVSRKGENYDDTINREISGHTILRFSIVEDSKPRKLFMSNPNFDWTDENYDGFLSLTFDAYEEWKKNILKRIASNDKWYNEIQNYRKQMSN